MPFFSKACRHMNEAKPSMSGFGIDVIQLMNTSGWPVESSVLYSC
ncbi:MAG: DUF2284 domain-containing protein [Thermodesulfobacteriota bacterium]